MNDTETVRRVDEQVARNNDRLERYYSGSTEHARRSLALREAYLRDCAIRRMREA